MKNQRLRIFSVMFLLVLIITTVFTGYKKKVITSSESANTQNKSFVVNKNEIKKPDYEINVYADYVAGLPKDLYQIADLVVIGTYKEDIKTFADETGLPITSGKISIDKVIKGNLEEDNAIIQFHGGIIPLKEYLRTEDKIDIQKKGVDSLSEEDIKKKTVGLAQTKFTIQKELDQQYLMFLSYDEETDAYFVGADALGMRPMNEEGKIFNPDTQQYETIDFAATG